jgi:alpha-glucosidase
MHAAWDARELRRAIAATTRLPGAAWALSNHDFGRLTTRFGAENARAALVLLLTLPGPAFMYQGDEIGQADAAPGEARFDRAGRDRFRHPMQWDASHAGGFTDGRPWLEAVNPHECNVEDQRRDPSSTLSMVRALALLRRELGESFELLDTEPGVLAYRRGAHVVAVNTASEALPVPLGGPARLETAPGALADGTLAAHAAAVSQG